MASHKTLDTIMKKNSGRNGWPTLLMVLGARFEVLKQGFNTGRQCVVKIETVQSLDRFFIVYDAAHSLYHYLEIDEKDLKETLATIKEF